MSATEKQETACGARPPRIHPTAIIEDGVEIGPGSFVWDGVHVRRGARIGADCIVGEKSYVAYDVRIGDRVKINAMVYICAGVTIERGVMISAGTVFTNDKLPRATTPDLARLLSSAPNEETLETLVCEGATIGANATIGPGITLGAFCMVGMGSVVTQSVLAHHLVFGNPATSHGVVCRCGHVLARRATWQALTRGSALACARCGLTYRRDGETLTLTRPAGEATLPCE
jgi:UDP-2-acetamido-3-amino-2,3-dideoxy-glucuronate N-acetyltransferase